MASFDERYGGYAGALPRELEELLLRAGGARMQASGIPQPSPDMAQGDAINTLMLMQGVPNKDMFKSAVFGGAPQPPAPAAPGSMTPGEPAPPLPPVRDIPSAPAAAPAAPGATPPMQTLSPGAEVPSSVPTTVSPYSALKSLFGNGSIPSDIAVQALGRGAQNIGASLMSIYNPKGAAVLAGQARAADSAEMERAKLRASEQQGKFSMHFDPASGKLFKIDTRTGQIMGAQAADPKKKTLDAAGMKYVADNMKQYGVLDNTTREAASLLEDLEKGKLELGPGRNLESSFRNAIGKNDPQSLAYAKLQRFVQQLSADQLALQNGVQTEGDAVRAMRQFVGGYAQMSKEGMREALHDLIRKNAAAAGRAGVFLDSYTSQYEKDAGLNPYVREQLERKKLYEDVVPRLRPAETSGGGVAPVTDFVKRRQQ